MKKIKQKVMKYGWQSYWLLLFGLFYWLSLIRIDIFALIVSFVCYLWFYSWEIIEND